jgi:hypothetical protein
LRWNGDEEMKMIDVVIDLFDSDFGIILPDVGEYLSEIFKDTVIEYLPAIFGREDEVVVTIPDGMIVSIVFFAHLIIIPRR